MTDTIKRACYIVLTDGYSHDYNKTRGYAGDWSTLKLAGKIDSNDTRIYGCDQSRWWEMITASALNRFAALPSDKITHALESEYPLVVAPLDKLLGDIQRIIVGKSVTRYKSSEVAENVLLKATSITTRYLKPWYTPEQLDALMFSASLVWSTKELAEWHLTP